MNKVIIIGRLVRDPEIRHGGSNNTAVSKFTLAVDRKYKKDGEPTADFINCTAFGKPAEFEEKYFKKGTKVCISGHIQTGSYINRDGNKVYTTDVIVEEQEFAESKAASQSFNDAGPSPAGPVPDSDGFINIPEGIEEDELPFM